MRRSSPSPQRVTRLGLPLTLNAVIHRGNIDEVEALIALAVDARRQAPRGRPHPVLRLGLREPRRPDADPRRRRPLDRAIVEAARKRLEGRLVIDLVVPDYYAAYPKACAGGWGRQLMNVTPAGKVLPCHAAETIPGLEFWSRARSTRSPTSGTCSPAFNAFRGTDWMPEPCRSCDRKERDWGGCRCQALALTGDAAATDPACSLSPFHARIGASPRPKSGAASHPAYVYRTIGGSNSLERTKPGVAAPALP